MAAEGNQSAKENLQNELIKINEEFSACDPENTPVVIELENKRLEVVNKLKELDVQVNTRRRKMIMSPNRVAPKRLKILCPDEVLKSLADNKSKEEGFPKITTELIKEVKAKDEDWEEKGLNTWVKTVPDDNAELKKTAVSPLLISGLRDRCVI